MSAVLTDVLLTVTSTTRSGLPDCAGELVQPGDEPSHYLLAHHVALMAMSRGIGEGGWISAATLDRCLLSIGHPQI